MIPQYTYRPTTTVTKPDLTQAQASVQAASARAGAYISSWGSWAADKRKQGWRKSEIASPGPEDSRPAVTTVSELSKEEVHDANIATEILTAHDEQSETIVKEKDVWAGV